jgi:hypothetical protein
MMALLGVSSAVFQSNTWAKSRIRYSVEKYRDSLAVGDPSSISIVDSYVKQSIWAEGDGEQWITEVIIGGTPSLPKPGRPDVVYEKRE